MSHDLKLGLMAAVDAYHKGVQIFQQTFEKVHNLGEKIAALREDDEILMKKQQAYLSNLTAISSVSFSELSNISFSELSNISFSDAVENRKQLDKARTEIQRLEEERYKAVEEHEAAERRLDVLRGRVKQMLGI